jgi:hypothetical protein
MATLKSTIRAVKAFGKGYSDLELKVRQATCNDSVMMFFDDSGDHLVH